MRKRRLCRYSILGGPVDALAELLHTVGGVGIVCATASSQVFASLSNNMAVQLRDRGLVVTRVQSVLPAVVSPPRLIYGIAEYSPGDMLDLLGLNNFRLSVTPPLFGEGFSVAVLDTGIRETHSLLGDSVVYSRNFSTGPDGDGFNHGTGVAAIIHAVVPNAGILDMKVIDSRGEGTEEGVVLAIEECIELLNTFPSIAPNIINMSLGSPDDNNPNNPVRVACRAAMTRGIVIVAAAGNNGSVSGAVTVPACERYVAAVGSISSSPFTVSEFSSRGPTVGGLVKPDTVFLGENIILASSESDVATLAKSGTSFSTPLTTGVIILTMEGVARTQNIPSNMYVGKNVVTSTVVIDDMLPTVCTKPEGSPEEKDNSYGYGVPVGSLIQGRTTAVGIIDLNATINLSITMMMMQVMAGLIMSGSSGLTGGRY